MILEMRLEIILGTTMKTERIHKHRAWDGEKMLYKSVFGRYWVDADGAYIKHIHTLDERLYTISEFTGQTDKNSVEIYEHDFLAIHNDGKTEIAKVFHHGGALCVYYYHNDYEFTAVGWIMDEVDYVEVVGNEFKNPELGGKSND